ncbi:TPA: membrane protein insertion efficiency factor YidD [Escherichia coli]|uniref:membrane protein insertion efficiency factor YidD n=1 Tax=unclassified Escherichia TaxID=2608889 RepID=UPI000CF76DD9|nr:MULTISPECIES: membrane protein insertion efficiency factor YidD [unclassified Escherichia]MBB2296309.1 membrane protein insertion efficiency factor YidD [Escherichia sp. 93.1462]HBC9290540.1 membrane protein insertion efficiency factor YidD [Escherichia coli]
MNKLILLLIMFYQRHLSPRKGYRCAYSVLYQTQGCSGAVKNIIQQKGVLAGWSEIRQRFADCRLAAQTIRQKQRLGKSIRKKKNNDCDCTGCDGAVCRDCHMPDFCPNIPVPDLDCSCDCSSLHLKRFFK